VEAPGARAGRLADRLQSLLEAQDMAGLGAFVAELEAGLEPPRTPARLAQVIGVGAAAGLGALRALADRRHFRAARRLRDGVVEEVAAAATAVLLVIEYVSDDDVVWLQRTLAARGRRSIVDGIRGCPLGLLHARSFETMTLLDVKQRAARATPAPRSRSLFIDCYLDRQPVEAAADVVVIPYREVSREYVAAHPGVDLLAVTAHGMSDLVHLNDDYLCGKSAYLGSDALSSGRLPSCMEDGGRCFFKPSGKALLARELSAAHVLVNSCGSLRFQVSDFDPLFNLGYAVLESRALSFLGTIRFKDGHGSEGLLYHHLLKHGFSLGEAACLVNLALFSRQLEAAPDVFFLVGDPDDTLADPEPRPPVQPLVEGINAIRLDGGFGIGRISSPELVRAFSRAELLIETGGPAPVQAAIAPATEADCLYVFLVSYEDLDQEVTLRVHRLAALASRLRLARRLIDENLGYSSGLTALYPERVRHGGKKNLDNRLINLAHLYKAAFTEPEAVSKLLSSWGKLEQEMDSTDAMIADWLLHRISSTFFRFGDQYQDIFLLEPGGERGTCEICGEEAAIRSLHHVLLYSMRRLQRICPRCGVIEDRPEGALSASIAFPPGMEKAARAPARLLIRNDSEDEYRGACLLAVRNGSQLQIRSTPAVQRIEAPAGQTVEASFNVELPGAIPIHRYTLQAAFISSTRVFLAARPFLVEAGPAGQG
jgi:hypothetical protein